MIIKNWFLRKILKKGNLFFIPCLENHYRPLFFESRFLLYVLLGLLVLKLAVIPFTLYLPTSDFFADVTKTALLNYTNEERTSRGLGSLQENLRLDAAAQDKASDMLQEGYFAHTSPGGVSPWGWFQQQGYSYQYAGENLAIGFLNSNEVSKAWMESEGHRQNILNPYYEDMGLAVLQGEFQGQETTLVVQFFGKTATSATIPAPIQPEVPPSVSQPVVEQSQPSVEGTTAFEEEQPAETSVPQETNSIISSPYRTPVSTSTVPSSGSESFLQLTPLLNFLNQNYTSALRVITLALLSLVSLAMILLVTISLEQQAPDLIARGGLAIIVLISFFFLGEEVLFKIIPHHFLIC
jgi:hypothetical protein